MQADLNWQHILTGRCGGGSADSDCLLCEREENHVAHGEHRLHRHPEKEGPLTVGGVIYPQQNGEKVERTSSRAEFLSR